jgi:glycosyltransferase involved in cell wall biosynthesis
LKRIVFVYPYLTGYIIPVLQGVVDSGRVSLDVLCSPPPPGMGFEEIIPPEHPNLHWILAPEGHPMGDRIGMVQKGVLRHILRVRPDAVVIWANPRFLSFWGMLLLGRLLCIPVYSRGHGLFKKQEIGGLYKLLYKLMYRVILAMSYRYICYTQAVKDSLRSLVKDEDKLIVEYNTLYNHYPLAPNQKTGKEKGVFYIGRIRDGCGVDVLIQALEGLNRQGDSPVIELHIIGDGPLQSHVQEQASRLPWLTYHGKEFDQQRVRDISRECRLGCVPGFMGLNVVHMMSLSLPVVTHARLGKHMGPEPEYIQHQVNGWLIEKVNDVASLAQAIKLLWLLPEDKFRVLQENAYRSYEKLSSPPYHERFLQILEG